MSFLDGIKNFNKGKLKDVVTVEKTLPQIEDEPKGKGRFSYYFGHEAEEEKIEWFDEPILFRRKCKKLANIIKNSDYIVVYTGAGISTAAKLPDYRGGDGMWTNRDQGTSIDKTKYVENISCALPTLSHMAIAELVHRGIIKSVVSTNVDGLHMRAGVEKSRLSELHGNSYLETCDTCGEKYLRTQDVLQNQTEDHRLVNRHWCGKYCEKEGCGGMLLDNIVAFGENLPEDELNEAIRQSKKGDLALVLDTTMMVQPACLLPKYIYKKPKGKMVICNLQTTPYDKAAALRIQGHIDDMW